MPGSQPELRPGEIDALVIGAGQSGLAASHCLSDLGIAHVVLERGEIANSWRHERWDSLRLLTPNWQAHLPGMRYDGPDPDGYMPVSELVQFLDRYAEDVAAPVLTETPVSLLEPAGDRYRVLTPAGEWRPRAVIIASGGFNIPSVPPFSGGLPDNIQQVTPREYRNPDQLEKGGVLVVGASSTGLQLAEEIHQSGRPVTLAVGEHVRLPRIYRGRDIQYWMDAVGVLDELYDEVDDLVRARHVPSPQLVGTPEHATLDLNRLMDHGVHVVGKLAGVRENQLLFSGGLRNVCALADLKMNRLLGEIDEWLEEQSDPPSAGPIERYQETRVEHPPCLGIDMIKQEIHTVLWATGYRPDYSWLNLDVLDRKGFIRHEGGVVCDVQGMYLLGLPFLRRRKSSFIHGAEDDARFVTDHLSHTLAGTQH